MVHRTPESGVFSNLDVTTGRTPKRPCNQLASVEVSQLASGEVDVLKGPTVHRVETHSLKLHAGQAEAGAQTEHILKDMGLVEKEEVEVTAHTMV